MNLQKHGSSNEGEIASANLLRGENYKKPNHEQIPSAVFISPLLASVGVEENDAKHQGLKFKVNHINASNWHSSRRFREKYSTFKVLIEYNTGNILGTHILGLHSEEVINICSYN